MQHVLALVVHRTYLAWAAYGTWDQSAVHTAVLTLPCMLDLGLVNVMVA